MSNTSAKCPYHPPTPKTIRDWWPTTLDLRILHQDPPPARPSHVPHPSQYAAYAAKFSGCDLYALRDDIRRALITSHPAWPADYGHYGPLMIRLAWHSAGTYRVPDNANLDKARRYVLWPIKQKYGQSISWADLIILAGNVALESMMYERWEEAEPLWFGGGRIDAFAPEEDVFWGNEGEWLKDDRHGEREREEETGLKKPLGATQGPGGNPDILSSAKDIRETFSRMGMTDLETVALIAGGHTFGKTHGAANPSEHVGAEPEGAPIEEMGLGWKNKYKSGKGPDTITSGLEGAWTAKPAQWDNGYFDNLFKYEWTQSKSPGGATQWIPSDDSISASGGMDAVAIVPDAHVAGVKHLPIMFTTDLALRYDPIYGPISKRFHMNPDEFKNAFKRAWYKLCHRDMGPKSRHLGPWVPKEDFLWMDPIPLARYRIIDQNDIWELKNEVLNLVHSSMLSISDLVKVAWGAASTYRCTDHRGGANGGRIRLAPQRDWEVNDPPTLHKVLNKLENLQRSFNSNNNTQVSIADLIVLGGNVAIEEAARQSGFGDIEVSFVPGRTDASQSETDIDSFNALRPTSDGFRNYEGPGVESMLPEVALLDRAHFLTLTAPELVVLVGGLRVLNANTNSSNGVLTNRPGVLTNDFFMHLLDLNTSWVPMEGGKLYKGTSPTQSWIASRIDLIFASNSQLRAISEAYACSDAHEHFIKDFVNAWTKVCMLDRFDLSHPVHADPRSKL
eukprot:CCRYP_020615-RB/>CCRYP_020615-RB protein AED:0.06 eAED:0.06 QI:63/0/0.33/1/0/0.33/3/185/732